MPVRLLLLSPEGESNDSYQNEIKKFNVELETVVTFKELFDTMSETPYCGILLDLNAKLRAPKNEYDLVRTILDNFPVADLRFDNKTKVIGIYYQGQPKNGGDIQDFVERICGNFSARKIGTEERLKINFNALLSKLDDFSEEHVERTIALNVSKSGCFLVSTNKWQVGDDAWFIIKDIEDQTPICAEVCWSVVWGQSIAIPGIGLEFKKINQTQVDQICNIKIKEGKQRE